MKRAEPEADQYFYTSAPIAGEGFHIVAVPARQVVSNPVLLDLISRLSVYNPPLDLPSVAEEDDIQRRFPVAVRAVPAPADAFVVLRSRYVIREYRRDGFGSRAGNFFAHIIVLPGSLGIGGPMACAMAVEWREGLALAELASTEEIRLPPLTVQAVTSAGLAAEPGDQAILAGVIGRLAGGPSVLLRDTKWQDALATFARIERFLTPPIAFSLRWSTYEVDLSRGLDILASCGETRLAHFDLPVFEPERSQPQPAALWGAQVLTEMKTARQVADFWRRVGILGGLAAAQPSDLLTALSLLRELGISEALQPAGDAGELLVRLWAHLSSLDPSPERQVLLFEIAGMAGQSSAFGSAAMFQQVLRINADVEAWCGSRFSDSGLRHAAYSLYLVPAIDGDAGLEALKSALPQLRLVAPEIVADMVSRFEAEIGDRRLGNAGTSDATGSTRALSIARQLGIDPLKFANALLAPAVERCLSAPGKDAASDLAERMRAIASEQTPITTVILTAARFASSSGLPMTEPFTDTFVEASLAALDSQMASGSTKDWSAALAALAGESGLQDVVAAIISKSADSRFGKDCGPWLNTVLRSVAQVRPGFMEQHGRRILAAKAMAVMRQGEPDPGWCIGALDAVAESARRGELPAGAIREFIVRLDGALAARGVNRESKRWAVRILDFCNAETVELLAETAPNVLCLAVGERVKDSRVAAAQRSRTAMGLLREGSEPGAYRHALKRLIPALLRGRLEEGDVAAAIENARMLWRETLHHDIEAMIEKAAREGIGRNRRHLAMLIEVVHNGSGRLSPADRSVFAALRHAALRQAARCSDKELELLEFDLRKTGGSPPLEFFREVRQKRRMMPGVIARNVVQYLLGKVGRKQE